MCNTRHTNNTKIHFRESKPFENKERNAKRNFQNILFRQKNIGSKWSACCADLYDVIYILIYLYILYIFIIALSIADVKHIAGHGVRDRARRRNKALEDTKGHDGTAVYIPYPYADNPVDVPALPPFARLVCQCAEWLLDEEVASNMPPIPRSNRLAQ